MSSGVDYARLRDQTLQSTKDEEAVTVNTRALIDKVLARYSGEWTTLRELIQNAADASASKVTIKFETLPSSTVPTPQAMDKAAHLKHTIQHHTLRRLVVSNDGQAFGESDWSRLKRIAEGNPDETKIGAFGVGFYSVFSECESPFVISGKTTLAFYWKENSLFTRKGKLPEDQDNSETSFVLDYRNTSSPVPNLMSICQFLSTSLTFIAIETIDLWLDDWNVFKLTKKAAPSVKATLPKDIVLKSKEGIMKISSVENQNAQVDATWINIVGWTPTVTETNSISNSDNRQSQSTSLRGFFSRLTGSANNSAAAKRAAREEEATQRLIVENIDGSSSATVFIRVSTVHVNCTVPTNFASELERATKKPPPKSTKIAILTSSHDETEASLSTLSGASAKKVAEVITSILPQKSGRIFIGFPTTQTTGLLAHISAPSLIPTVERESIDLNARYVKQWNTELLSIAGIASRIAYASEMNTLRGRYNSSVKNGKEGEKAVDEVLPSAVHLYKQFTFRETTPLTKAGEAIEEAFWTCGRKASIEICSSQGILPSHEVRLASEDLSFVKGIPVVPDLAVDEAKSFIDQLRGFGLLNEITTSDIKNELEKQALSEQQLEEFLKWAAKKTRAQDLELAVIKSMFNVTLVETKQENDDKNESSLLALSNVTTYINSSRVSPDLPVPAQTIPFRFTKGLNQADMHSFGWEELQLIPWIRFLLDSVDNKRAHAEKDMTSWAPFATQVLQTCSKNFDGLSQSSKLSLVNLLNTRTIIPTKFGMKIPSEAYFQSVKLFDDLPVVKLDGVKEKFLKALGVRKTIDLSVIFERLMSADTHEKTGRARWSHVDLVRYLVSVWDDIPSKDIEQLRATALCPAEKDNDPSVPTEKLFRVAELYEPKDSLRALGLPVLQWPTHLNAYSSDGKFLRMLGLRAHPSAPELVQLLASAGSDRDVRLYEEGLRYFIENHYQNNYGAFDLSDTKAVFVPLDGQEKLKLVRPSDCFVNAEAKVMDYKILRQDLKSHATKFGVRENPPMADCAARLIKTHPQDKKAAKAVFTYFASRSNEITPSIADRLGASSIVPIEYRSKSTTGESRIRLATPSSCFLGDGEEYGDIFDYVDYGPEANVFLLKIGSKHEPTTSELTRHVIREPARIFDRLGVDRYQGLLRKLRLNMDILKKDRTLWKDMKSSPFLLAYTEVPKDSNAKEAPKQVLIDDLDEDLDFTIKEWHLKTCGQVVIVDDVIVYSLFKQHIFAAPQEEELEELYLALGSPKISNLVEEEPRLGPRAKDQQPATVLRSRILERARLFLHEQPPNTILHDTKWLEKHLDVQVVQNVSLRLTLKGTRLSHLEKRTACLTSDRTSKALLSIVSHFESFDVSSEIVHLLIDRPRTQSKMLMEMMLTTPLHKLRTRGYNVERILRRRAAEEARVAELDRQRKKEEEEKRLREIENTRAIAPIQPQSKGSTKSSKGSSQDVFEDAENDHFQAPVPGAFNTTPDRATSENAIAQIDQQKPRGGLFSSLTKRLGFDEDSNAVRDIQRFLGGNNTIPQMPNFGNRSMTSPGLAQSTFDPTQLKGNTQNQAGAVTSPNQIQQNLSSAINASRAYNSNTLFNRPSTNTVEEVRSWCDQHPSHNLTLISTTSPGIPVYLTPTASSDPTSFIASNNEGLNAFAYLLLEAGVNVFGLKKGTLHIYFDESATSIAFNSQGSIFCNFRYFAQLHLAGFGDPSARAQALVYWWVVLCHELSHNLVSDHSADHSYYTEMFVVQYFPVVAGRITQMVAMGGETRGELESAPPGYSDPAFNGVERAFS